MLTESRASGTPTAPEALTTTFRQEYGAVVAALIRRFGDIDVAEDAVGEALAQATTTWPRDGVPPNPAGWLVTTAGNRAIDRLRREALRPARHAEAIRLREAAEPARLDQAGPIHDDRLRLIFTCCHPALAPDARVALTLRLLGGLTVAEIARAFLVEETTLAQRLTRAKRKIKMAGIPYRVPTERDVPARLSAVLAVLFLVFNEGYLTSTEGSPAVREDLCGEAIRLTRLLRELLPGHPEITGLLALMLLQHARRSARFAAGRLIPLPEQDRSGWDRTLIGEGHDLVRNCLRRNQPGYYQILAAINAVHTDAATFDETDWQQIGALYDQLMAVRPSPVVALNRAVAVGELDGPQVALAQVDGQPLSTYHAWHAARAEFLRRLGRPAEAADAYDRAIELAGNLAEQEYLRSRRASLPPS